VSESGGYTSYEEAPFPLTDRERKLLKRMFSDFMEVPGEWVTALKAALEADPPILGAAALGSSGGGGGLLVGEIKAWPFAAVPSTAWEFCSGQSVSRAGKYSNLHTKVSALGYPAPFGPGDGSTTFTLPNLKGRVMVHQDPGQAEFDLVGELGGAKTHTLSVTEMPNHRHAYAALSSGGGPQRGVYNDNWDNSTLALSTSNGSDQPHNNLQPFIVIPAIIYLG
jgi:microcystin-dependent protein